MPPISEATLIFFKWKKSRLWEMTKAVPIENKRNAIFLIIVLVRSSFIIICILSLPCMSQYKFLYRLATYTNYTQYHT